MPTPASCILFIIWHFFSWPFGHFFLLHKNVMCYFNGHCLIKRFVWKFYLVIFLWLFWRSVEVVPINSHSILLSCVSISECTRLLNTYNVIQAHGYAFIHIWCLPANDLYPCQEVNRAESSHPRWSLTSQDHPAQRTNGTVLQRSNKFCAHWLWMSIWSMWTCDLIAVQPPENVSSCFSLHRDKHASIQSPMSHAPHPHLLLWWRTNATFNYTWQWTNVNVKEPSNWERDTYCRWTLHWLFMSLDCKDEPIFSGGK